MPAPKPRLLRVSVAVLIGAIIAGVLCGAVGANSVLRRTKVFQSAAFMQIDQPTLIVRSTSEGAINKLNVLRTKYAALAETRRITVPVSQRTGYPAGAIADAVNVVPAGQSLLLIVAARTAASDRSRLIADAVAEELITELNREMVDADVPVADRIVMSIVSPAQPGIQIEPTRSRAITVGMIAGIIAMFGFVVAAESLRSIRRRR